MFTGLIEATGRIDAIDRDESGGRVRLQTAIAGDLRPGDSLAVNGICLTVTSQTATHVTADLAPVTLEITTFGTIASGRLVNHERPVRADDRMGGHFVLGHGDGTARIRSFVKQGDCFRLDVDVPPALEPYVVSKGSIAIDGISLTVASLAPGLLTAQIIPFTRAHTALAEARAGDLVNLEMDVLGKYVARLLSTRFSGGVDRDATASQFVPSAFVRALSGESQ